MQTHSIKRVYIIFACTLLIVMAFFPLVSRSQSLTTLGMPIAQSSACSPNGEHLVPWLGDRWYLSGVNVPWQDGGYGADFGTVEEWGQHTYSSAATEQMFADLQAHGVNSVRWWVFADGRGAPEFDASSGGNVTGLDANFLPSMVDAINLAARYDIYIVFNLWSFDMLHEDSNANDKGEHAGGHRDLIVERGKRQSFINNALLPMLSHPVDGTGYTIGTHPNVLGWDIINEPEWAITEAVGGQGSVSLAEMRRFVAKIAGAIHRNSSQLVTVGSASIKWNSDTALGAQGNWWHDAALTPYDADGYLDFYQVHYYPWMDGDGVTWSYSPLSTSWASGSFDKPTVIGELPGLASMINPLLDGIYTNCYAGTWMWSYAGVDNSGNWPESKAAYARFNSQHADEVTIRPSGQQPDPTATITPLPSSEPDDDPVTDPPAAVYTVSADGLASDWANWSWNTTVNLTSATPRHSGSSAIAATYTAPWAGLYLHTNTPIPTAEYDTLRFSLHGGTAGGQRLRVWLRDARGNAGASIDVTGQAGTWTQVDVPLRDLGNLATISDIFWQDSTGKTQPTFHIDDVALVSHDVTAAPTRTSLPSPTATATAVPTQTPLPDPTERPDPTSTAMPTVTATVLPDQPPGDDPDQSAGAFLETFDGDPSAPLPWREVAAFNTWDVAVHSRDVNTWQTLQSMNAAHGSNCDPHPATHSVSAYEDAVFQCKNHVMTAINADGYGVIYLTPDHMVDFSNGEAVVRFDISTLITSGRDWWDVWITPYEDNLQLPLQDVYPDLNGPPRRAVQIRMAGDTLLAYVYEDFVITQQSQFSGTIPTQWWIGYESFLVPDARRRDTFEIRLSQNHLKVGMPDYNFWWIDSPIEPLDWNQGIVQFGHHSYTPTKDCNNCGPNTWHWDNISIDPAIPFTIIQSDKRWVSGSPNITGEPILSFDRPAPSNAHLRFSGTGNNLQVSFDDGATWQAARYQAHGKTPGNAATFWMPIPEGVSRVQFRGERWWGGDWFARDATIWAHSGSASR